MIGMIAQSRDTFKSSELRRASEEVFAAAADHPVTVTRPDGEPLVLMSEREDLARNELLKLAAQLMGIATIHDEKLVPFMTEHFPWMLALRSDDRESCAREIFEAARASFSTGQAHLALSTLTSWRETAEAITAGLRETPVEWLDDDEPVERP